MQTNSAFIYDKIYAWKDYQNETEKIKSHILAHCQSGDNQLLDVACGTGKHIQYLKSDYQVEGLDFSVEMLEIARLNHPEITFHQADMSNFDLGKTYDILTCLFSAIGYVKTLDAVEKTLVCMFKHLKPGGLLLLEPWFTPDEWQPNTVHSQFIDEPDLKIARINTSLKEGNLSIFDLHHLVGTPESTTHFVEHHALGLFEKEDLLNLFRKTRFQVLYQDEGISGRGLYIAIKENGHK